MPITLKALTGPLGVSRASSQLAACVGTNFNNDGTALYQAAAVLFMAQALGFQLSFVDQLVVAFTTSVASIGAGCIPSGSFVTLPLIFAAVGLQADKIPLLLTIDWFLDRCRTTSQRARRHDGGGPARPDGAERPVGRGGREPKRMEFAIDLSLPASHPIAGSSAAPSRALARYGRRWP